MLTRSDILMGRDVAYPLDELQEQNLEKTLATMQALEQLLGFELTVTSGYRPAAINARVAGAAPKSKHIQCLAVDFSDESGALAYWCLNNIDWLERLGLWMEHPDFTEGWVHLQVVPPKSGRRVFKP